MRPIGLVAAAAAGVIAPLAIAMPALATTQSSVLSGVTSFGDGGNGPDNGDNGKDDNGDNGKDDNGDHNGDNGKDDNGDNGKDDNGDHNGDNGDHNGDNGDHNGDNGDHNGDNGDHNGDRHGDRHGPFLSAHSAGSKASGDVSIIVDVDKAGPFDTYRLESPALDAGCDFNTITGATAEADRFGDLNASGDAFNCLPGTYKIAVSQTGDHEKTFYVDVHVD